MMNSEVSTKKEESNISLLQTPRRSARKSVKPAQDYNEIVSSKTRSATKNKENECMEENDETVAQPKWTPARVGRVSQKRGRKHKRSTAVAKNIEALKTDIQVNEEGNDEKLDQQCDELMDVEQSNDTFQANEVETQSEEEIKPSLEKESTDDYECLEGNDAHAKWSQDRDGRVSQKRGRKQKRTTAVAKNIEVLKTDIPEREMENEQKQGDVMKDFQKSNDVEEANEKVVNSAEETNTSLGEEPTETVIVRHITADDVSPLKSAEELIKSTVVISPDDGVDIAMSDNTNATQNDTNNANVTQSASIARDSAIELCASGTSAHFEALRKPNEIDMSDLGLKPIEDDGKAEEMPSLIVCDDDDDDDDEQPVKSANDTFDAIADDDKENFALKECVANQHNDTFNNSDCMIISPEQQRASTPNKPAPHKPIHGNDYAKKEVAQNVKEPTSNKKVRINPEQMLHTPKQKSKDYRFPTPYKQQLQHRADVSAKSNHNGGTTADSEQLSTTLPTTTNASIKDIVLRSIRKRSLSVCIDGKEELRPKRGLNRVYFYSPANQTANIDEVDLLMAKNQTQSSRKVEIKRNNVNLRRRRSMSAENVHTLTVPKFLVTKDTPSKQLPTPRKASSNVRTKIPNFAAIHQKQFNKMENLAEHIARKAERAKILINSATKLKTASAQKNITESSATKPKAFERSKASKRINLNGDNDIKQQMKKTATVTTTTAMLSSGINDNITEDLQLSAHLPKPTVNLLETQAPNTQRRIPVLKAAAQPPAATKKQAGSATHTMQPKKVLKPTQQHNLSALPIATKPNFNLSTTYQPTKFNATTLDSTANAGGHTSYREKLSTRRQRHIDMFKGRSERVGAGTAGPARRQAEIIRGVRSNRRFDLQMQHRRNLEH